MGFQQYFSYIMAVSFIGGGNESTRRKPLTCRKSFFCNLQSRVQTHAVLVIGLYELLGNPTT
jgi:hypothetical protein